MGGHGRPCGRPCEAKLGGRGRPKWEAKVGGCGRPKWEAMGGREMPNVGGQIWPPMASHSSAPLIGSVI